MSAAAAPCPWPIGELLPHGPAMTLIDRALSWDRQSFVGEARIGPDHPFCEGDHVPAYVGIEIMAQACAAFVGADAKSRDEPVRIGLLLGSRRYETRLARFPIGLDLRVSVAPVYRDDRIAMFDGRLTSPQGEVAEAQLVVYQPQDLAAVLAGGKDMT